MTYLVDYQIEKCVEGGLLSISPFSKSRIQPSSIDLTLNDSFIIEGYKKYRDELCLYPHEFVLGSTVEHVTLPANITGEICGCSTIGRGGLFVQNAGHIDPGFDGKITLELFNASDKAITLQFNQRICQMRFDMHATCRKPYSGRYQGQIEATAGRDKI